MVTGRLLYALELSDDVAQLEQHHRVNVVLGHRFGWLLHVWGGDVAVGALGRPRPSHLSCRIR